MPGSAARSRARDRIVRIAGSSIDADAMRLEVIAELRRAIGFVSWCWPLMDPEAVLPTTALFDLEFSTTSSHEACSTGRSRRMC